MYSYKYKNTFIAILLACILTMAIGYALLQQRLDIRGFANISSRFDVRFTDIVSTPSNDNVTDKVVPSYTATTATFSTNLTSPGDYMTYDITVSNLGTLNAELLVINISDNDNPAIDFSYEGIKVGDILKAGDSTVIKVTVKYNQAVSSQPDNVNAELTINLNYGQTDKTVDDETVVESNSYLAKATYTGVWLNGPLNRNEIESVSFTTTNVVPSEAGDSYWDASSQGDGSIIAWYTDTDSDGLKEVTIGQNGGVKANPDSSYLFYNFTKATSIDVTHLNTSDVTVMTNMFKECSKLSTLDLSIFDTSNVTSMGGMFHNCSSLISLNLSGFNTSNVTNMSDMFNKCSKLSTLDLSSFDTSNVTSMGGMFHDCSGLTSLDLSNFDTYNTIYANSMFTGCSKITILDLSNFNTSNVINMNYMFNQMDSLTTIYVSELWSNENVTSSIFMFDESPSLVGSIAYDETKIDVTYANYETGYFTYKAASN